ncbi:MAG: Fic family protein [Oscillospiraceae bacterium]
MDFKTKARSFSDPEMMAQEYLRSFFGNNKIEYPINPFAILKTEGLLFTISNFEKLEGVYIPASSPEDIPVIGINGNRPITRQRFTAAHELCHHFRDSDKQVSCPISGKKDSAEKFADSFAAAILMPLSELRIQVKKHKGPQGFVDFNAVLEIADYFGVSFETCLFRIAYKIHAIDGDTEPPTLKKRARKFRPDAVRKERHMSYANLYAGLLDNYEEQLSFAPSDHARLLFQSNYIYNDSRMEGLEVTLEEASEIVTDLRLNSQNSVYCNEDHEAFLSVAGHYAMYQDIFALPVKESINVYDTLLLHRKLFSYYPHPEFGGQIRQNNTLVLGAKFETVDYHEIYNELSAVDHEIKQVFDSKNQLTISEYIMHVAKIHHRITVIHPFPEGNGRTSRAFMNVQLVRAGLTPVYVKVENKSEYTEALARADKTGDYDELNEIMFKLVLRSHIELKKE